MKMSLFVKNIHTASEALMRPVDSSTLGAFRIVFGVCLAWAIYQYFSNGWIESNYIARELLFTYPFFHWVKPWPGNGMYYHFAIVGIAAILIALGLFYRLAAAVFFLGYSYIFLLDQVEYNNHYYLICLLGFVFCFIHADRWMAVDGLRKKDKTTRTVPYWNVFILRAQIVIVYFYGGIAKINMDWLNGEPLRHWLPYFTQDRPSLSHLLDNDFAAYTFSYGGLIIDLTIGFFLLWKKTRVAAICLLVFFHFTNHFLFQIGVFPFLMLGATVLFLEPDTPRKFLNKLLKKDIEKTSPSDIPKAHSPKLAMSFVAIYLCLQLLIPLRHWLYPGNVAWTEEGDFFSWRMKLKDKSCVIKFVGANPETKETWVIHPERDLDQKQLNKICQYPALILNYANHLGEKLKVSGMENPIIIAKTNVSLNFRTPQPIVDPKMNLIEKDYSLFRHSDWITQLKGRTSLP